MLMGIDGILALAKTPEQRKEMKDEDIDFSDIPRVTDFSRFVRGKSHFCKMREHNRQNRLEHERLQKAETVK